MSIKSNRIKEQMASLQGGMPRDLGDGLVLRFATLQDSERLAQFNGRIFGKDRFDEHTAAWTRDFMSPSHPTCGPSNVFLVEDTTAGNKIVSSACLIPQTWTFGGIPFEVGRPEAVGTDPEYRRRGLVRAIFEGLHAKSQAMGHLIQAITGIFWFYRQFDYDYAIDLGGGRTVPLAGIADLKQGEPERYHLRPMTTEDLPFSRALYDRAISRSLVAMPRPDWLWRHLLSGYSPDSSETRPYQMIETEVGRPVGYLAPMLELGNRGYPIIELEIAPGEPIRSILPSVLRGLKGMAQEESTKQQKEITALYFQLGREHPIFDAAPDFFTRTRAPYGWYVRVPDMVALLRRVTPVLEERLSNSALAGYTGEIKILEYVRAIRLEFERGKLVQAEPWSVDKPMESNAWFPPFAFSQLVFGFRSLAELRAAYPDCGAQDETAVLLEILFPRRASCVIPLG